MEKGFRSVGKGIYLHTNPFSTATRYCDLESLEMGDLWLIMCLLQDKNLSRALAAELYPELAERLKAVKVLIKLLQNTDDLRMVSFLTCHI